MENSVRVEKSFVSFDNQTVIVCPDCELATPLSVLKFRDRNHVLKVKCKCGYTFKVQLEFRKHVRKKVDLEGEFQLNRAGSDKWKIALVDLSLGGVCLEFKIPHNLNVGEEGTVRFILNDQKHTVINREIIIKSLASKIIRCQFLGENTFQKDLGFYLRS